MPKSCIVSSVGVPADDFGEFVTARLVALTGFAYLICGDRIAAQDLVQSALTKTLRHWKRVDHGRAEAYVRTAIVNEQRMAWRRRSRGELPTAVLPETAARDGYREVDELDALRQALLRLPVRQRAAIVLRHLEDRPVSEVAELLGCSEGTVKSQTSRGLIRLRALLAEDTIADRVKEEGQEAPC